MSNIVLKRYMLVSDLFPGIYIGYLKVSEQFIGMQCTGFTFILLIIAINKRFY